jgi:hypothetical protein
MLEAHGLDETPFHTYPASVTGFAYPHFQALQLLQALRHFCGKNTVESKVAATIAAVADGHKLIGPVDPQPERIPPQPPDHGNQSQGHRPSVMGHGFFYRGLPSQRRNDLLRSFPQKKASDLLRVTLTGLEISAEASMENKTEG